MVKAHEQRRTGTGADGWDHRTKEVAIRIESLDPEMPLRLMTTRSLARGDRRQVAEAGVLVYEGEVRAAEGSRPGVYAFAARFSSEQGAALLANVLWSELVDAAVSIELDGVSAAMQPSALRDALVGAPAPA